MTSTQLRPTRRTLVRGAAWSVPVVSIAAAAPAFAASCDSQLYRLDWGVTDFTPGPTTGATRVATATVGGTTGGNVVIASFSSTVTGSVTRASDNMTISDESDIGDLGNAVKGLNISHSAAIVSGRGNRQDIAISFNKAVTGLTFTITDIDSAAGNWYDRVELAGGPTRTFTVVDRPGTTTGNYVRGDGTNTTESNNNVGPWRFYDNDTNVPISGTGANLGNVTVTYAGSLAANTPITLSYWSTVGGGNQRIVLADLEFTSKAC